MSTPIEATPTELMPLVQLPDVTPIQFPSPVMVLRAELEALGGELRSRLYICEERLSLLEPQVEKIPAIDSRTLRTEKMVMDLQKALTTKQEDLQKALLGKMDLILGALQPRVTLP